ncbi:MAG: DNA repair protein RecN [Acidobacteria bacterium]|nr:DNA repair protein RecN [Acidobacteriota bacterium]
MLHELHIENYAVVARLRVGFDRGLNLLTGETGSGKSIVVDALSLLLGARADAGTVRAGADKARLTGRFELSPSPELVAVLAEAEQELEDGELLIERVLQANGKSRAYVNGRPATAALLKDLSDFLGDIHGQHEQQSLFSTRSQLEMLDSFAGVVALKGEVAAAWRQWRELAKKLAELRGAEKDRLKMLELYKFQLTEIQGAKLQPGEDEQLEQERRKLVNVARLQESAATAYDALYDAGASAAAQLKTAVRALEELGRYDESFNAYRAGLEEARAAVEDAAFELQSYLDGLEADPGRLDAVEERLALLERLRRKYSKSLDELIAYGAELADKVEELEDVDHAAGKIEKRRAEAAQRYRELAAQLSARRGEAGTRLAEMVQSELGSLAMERARFGVGFEGGEAEEHWTAEGYDRIRFEFSANAGQPLRPLAQVASGGELSRVTLALKSGLLAQAPSAAAVPRTLVFDEVDTGVGGRVAEAIGRRLKRLSGASQVLCVTHLPQIAGFADAHYFVEKVESDQQTFAKLVRLGESERVQELARMLSGAEVTAAALENAQQLIVRKP